MAQLATNGVHSAPSNRPSPAFSRWEWAGPAVALVPLLLVLGCELQEVDPTEYAEVARRIFTTGDWVNLNNGLGPFLNKPPFTFWCQAIAFHLFGPSAWTARLPSLLANVLTVVAVARVGTLLWDRRTGALAATLVACSPALHLMVADPKVDGMVTAWITTTVWLTLEARTRRWAMPLAWISAGFGVLSKGPIAVVVPVLAVLPEAIRQRWDGAARPAWQRLAPLWPLLGPLLMVAVAAPWFVLMSEATGIGGPRYILWGQSFGRVLHTDTTYADSSTPLFFLHTGLWAYLPASVPLAAELIRRAVGFVRGGFKLPVEHQRVALWWFVLPLAIISASIFKLPQYGFWLAPPAALLGARSLLRWPALTSGWLAAVGLLSAAGVALVVRWGFPSPLAALWIALPLLITLAGWLLARRFGRILPLAVSACLGGLLFFHGHLYPALLEYQPDRELAQKALEVDPSGTLIPYVGPVPTNAVSFYSQRTVRGIGTHELPIVVKAGQTSVAVTLPELVPQLEAHGLVVTRVMEVKSYPTSKPRGRFLRADTREETLRPLLLVQVRLSGGSTDPG
jgi:4-amino-4-deoxy-L-arabinose transferase-like glycosyltransferase